MLLPQSITTHNRQQSLILLIHPRQQGYQPYLNRTRDPDWPDLECGPHEIWPTAVGASIALFSGLGLLMFGWTRCVAFFAACYVITALLI
jgi:hypothetical protein